MPVSHPAPHPQPAVVTADAESVADAVVAAVAVQIAESAAKRTSLLAVAVEVVSLSYSTLCNSPWLISTRAFYVTAY